MIKRDLLNHLNQKIGEIEFPDDTPQELIDDVLSKYSAPPPSITIADIIKNKILEYEILAPKLLREVKAANTLNGITVEQSAQMFEEYAPIMIAVREGAFPTALYMLQQKQPSGFMTQERIDQLIAIVKTYI